MSDSEMSPASETSPAANGGDLEQLVMHKTSEELIDKLALMLGIAGDESAEARWNDELFKRKVLRAAILALNKAWNPPCCEGGPQWGHSLDCKPSNALDGYRDRTRLLRDGRCVYRERLV